MIRIDRKAEIIRNIKSFNKLSPSEKIRYVESAKERLKYYRSLKFVKEAKGDGGI